MNFNRIKHFILESSNPLLTEMLNHNVTCAITESNKSFDEDIFKSGIKTICDKVIEEITAEELHVSNIDKSLVESCLDFEAIVSKHIYSFNNELPTVKEYVDTCIEAVTSIITNKTDITEQTIEETMRGLCEASGKELLSLFRGDKEFYNGYMTIGERFDRLCGLLECVNIEECDSEFKRLVDFVQNTICENKELTLAEKGECVIGILDNAVTFYGNFKKAFNEAVYQEKQIIADLLMIRENKIITEKIANDTSIDIF